MNIAYVRNTFPKLSETFILEEILTLKRHHAVRIYAKWWELEKISPKILESGLLECVEYQSATKLSPGRKIVAATSMIFRAIFSSSFRKKLLCDYFPDQTMVRSLIRSPAVDQSPERRVPSFLLEMSIFLDKLIQVKNFSLAAQQVLIRRHAFVPEHGHCPFLYDWDAGKLSEIIRSNPYMPYTICLRAKEVYSAAETRHAELKKLLLKNATQVFTISKYNAENFSTIYETSRPIKVIHSFIDTEFFKPGGQLRKTPGLMICVARLVEKKGIPHLIDAVAAMKRGSLLIVGDGPLRQVLEDKVAQLGQSHRIAFAGNKSSEDIRCLLEQAEVFILPCVIAKVGDRDILPNCLKKAMAMELPVVTSDISGIRELVEPGHTGLLCRASDVDDMREKIEMLLSDVQLRRKLGQHGRQAVVASFSVVAEGRKLPLEIERMQRAFTSFMVGRAATSLSGSCVSLPATELMSNLVYANPEA